MKKLLTSDLVLQLPQLNHPFRVFIEAWNYGIGASLEQPTGNGKEWKTVAFRSSVIRQLIVKC